jgi:holo-[acyl-carrier protein] synthase
MNVGIDIEEVVRFKNMNLEKIFSPAELSYIKQKSAPAETAAGMYCAKEAYFKATGTGIIMRKLPEVEIAHDVDGKPYYKNDANAALSISHTKSTAAAVCIIF